MVNIIYQYLQLMWHLRVFVLSICHKTSTNLLVIEREICKDGEYKSLYPVLVIPVVPYKFFSDRYELGIYRISADGGGLFNPCFFSPVFTCLPWILPPLIFI